jgi:hypothetical protein
MSDKKQKNTARQEIAVNQRWKDSWGVKIIVTGVTETRITYIRDGYAHNCVCSEYRFRNEFSYLPVESADRQAAAKIDALEKVQDLKNKLQVAAK